MSHSKTPATHDDKLSCRRAFLTGKGRVGLGRAVQYGDETVLLAGTKHPYVVRRSLLRDGYELQAPAIVESMMTGAVWSSVEDSLEYVCLVSGVYSLYKFSFSQRQEEK